MLVIIGSGLAGYMLAKEWRKQEAHSPLTIITADEGAFYSKPLLSTALAQRKAPAQLVVSDAESMARELRAQIYTHAQVTGLDPLAQTLYFSAGSGSLSYSQLVFACGAENSVPALKGDALSELKTINNLGDYRLFRESLANKKRVAILGSGLVGCEFANDLQQAGYETTLISLDEYPLKSFLPKEIGHILKEKLSQTGVVWRLQSRPESLHWQDSQLVIGIENQQPVVADIILSATGLRPKVDLARRSGIAVNHGIRVNRWLQTNFANIFALGDCAEVDGLVQMYVAPLLQSARALAKILTGGRDPVHYPVMPVVLKTPVLPLVFVPPPASIIGHWHLEGEGDHLRGLFHDSSGQLRGFVLTGEKIRDKIPLAKQLPIVLSE